MAFLTNKKHFSNHSSLENFKELLDDEEFLLEAARISRNPAECSIFFYDYVNPHLKKNKDFRLKFLKSIYLNDNVFKLDDIETIVEYCEMQKENDVFLVGFKDLLLCLRLLENMGEIPKINENWWLQMATLYGNDILMIE